MSSVTSVGDATAAEADAWRERGGSAHAARIAECPPPSGGTDGDSGRRG